MNAINVLRSEPIRNLTVNLEYLHTQGISLNILIVFQKKLGQQSNDCGVLVVAYVEFIMTNDYDKIGTFGFNQDELEKLRLSHKEIIHFNDYNWRLNIKS